MFYFFFIIKIHKLRYFKNWKKTKQNGTHFNWIMCVKIIGGRFLKFMLFPVLKKKKKYIRESQKPSSSKWIYFLTYLLYFPFSNLRFFLFIYVKKQEAVNILWFCWFRFGFFVTTFHLFLSPIGHSDFSFFLFDGLSMMSLSIFICICYDKFCHYGIDDY